MYITKHGTKKMPFYALLTEDTHRKLNTYAKLSKTKKYKLIEKLINDNLPEVAI